jgi:hypothetical protein
MWLAIALAACRRAPPTYQDVAPILAANCTRCHAGLAPPPLATASEATRVAGLISVQAQQRKMPPWGPDLSGLCGRWHDAPALSAGEIETLVAWADSRPAPTPAPAPAPAAPFHPDLEIDSGAEFTPTLGAGASHCFRVAPLQKDALISGVTAVPEDAILRASLWEVPSEAPAADWPCDGAIPDARPVAAWSWNQPIQRLPATLGVRVTAGRTLALQVRYNLVALGLSSAVRARLELETRGTRAVELVPLGTTPLARPARLWGVLPAMKPPARVLRIAHGGECLAYFGHWMVDDQQLFTFEEGVPLAAGDSLTMTCDGECAAWLLLD